MTNDVGPRPKMHLTRMGLAILVAALITPLGYLMSERRWNSCRTRIRRFARLEP